MNEKSFKIQAKGNGSAELLIYGDVDDAKGFVEQLNSLGTLSSLDIRINSPGGSVFEGLAIYNAIDRHRARKTVFVDGLAASVASLIAMAGQTISMAENASMMIHNPYGVVAGNVEDMQKMADTLTKIKGSMVQAYVKKTKLPEEEISDMMDAETWMTAKEALEMGFATEISKSSVQAQVFNLSTYGYRNAPVTNVSQGQRSPGGKSAEDVLDEIDFNYFKALKVLGPKARYEYHHGEAQKALRELTDEQLAWAKREGFLK